MVDGHGRAHRRVGSSGTNGDTKPRSANGVFRPLMTNIVAVESECRAEGLPIEGGRSQSTTKPASRMDGTPSRTGISAHLVAPRSRLPKGMLTFWTRARRLLWSWWPWALVSIWAIGDARWGWAIGGGAMAAVSYLIALTAAPPRFGLDHEFSIDSTEFVGTVAGASGSPFLTVLLEQFGGANGELAAAMQYSIQELNCEDPEQKTC